MNDQDFIKNLIGNNPHELSHEQKVDPALEEARNAIGWRDFPPWAAANAAHDPAAFFGTTVAVEEEQS